MKKYLLFCFVFFLCMSNAYAVSHDRIKIGLSLSLTGKYSQMGIMQKKGFKLWQETVNANGGVLNTPIELIISDDQSNPNKARSIYSNLVEKTKVDFLFGPYSSGITEEILPIAEKHQYPILLSGASADRLWEKNYQFAFGVYTPASKYTVGFLQMLVRYKLKRIAIVSADDSFSMTLAENTEKWASRFGLNVVYTNHFKKGLADVTVLAEEMKSKQPDVVVICGHLNESVDFKKAFTQIQWNPKGYYASVGPAMGQYYELLGREADLTFSSSQWELDACGKYPFGNEFVQLFQSKYGHEPSYHAATAFAAGMILEKAINSTNTFDKTQIRKMLSQMDTMTIIGRYGVDKLGKQSRHFPLIIQWQNGVKKVVWPEKIKMADPVFNP